MSVLRSSALCVLIVLVASAGWVPPASAQQDEGTSDVISLDVQPATAQQPTQTQVQDPSYEEAVITGGVFFRNSSGENQLDAGEEAELTVTLSNQGTKAAQGVEVTVHSATSVTGLTIGDQKQSISTEARTVAQVSALQPSGARELSIPLYAPESLPEEDLQLVVGVRAEVGQVVGSPDKVTIPTGEVTTDPLVDRKIPKGTIDRPNAVAVVIGVSTYMNDDIPPVDFAVRDAETIRRYLVRTLGFAPENIISLENPTQSRMNAVLGTSNNYEGRLHDYLPTDSSEVFVFYSGHGAPNPSEDGRTYFLPSDATPNQLSLTGYPVDLLYENLAKVTSGPVTVAIDACFSGQSESGTLVQNASPAMLKVENPMLSLKEGLVFTASMADEVSSWYPEKKHGLFTYFFLKGVRGEADRNDDQEIVGSEMKTYLNEHVPQEARRLHSRSQNPQVMGQAMDRVLVRYSDEN